MNKPDEVVQLSMLQMRLRATERRFRIALAICGLLLAGSVLFGLWIVRVESAPLSLRARSLELTDERGKTRVRITAEPRLEFFDQKGLPRFEVELLRDGSPFVRLYHPSGLKISPDLDFRDAAIELRVLPDDATILVNDTWAGRGFMGLGVDANGTSLALIGPRKERTLIEIGATGRQSLTLSDAKGTVRVGIALFGDPVLRLRGEDGRVLFQAPK